MFTFVATSPQMISEADRERSFDQTARVDSAKAIALAEAGFFLMRTFVLYISSDTLYFEV